MAENATFRTRLEAVVGQYLTEVATPHEYLSLLRWQLAERHPLHERTTMPGHVTTSAIVLSPDGVQVLLIDHIVIGRWLQPGGHYEPAPSFFKSAMREAMEETGIADPVLHPWHGGRDLPFVIDSHDVVGNPSRGEVAHVHHDLQYLFFADPTQPLVAQRDEVHAAAWKPVSALSEMSPKAAGRFLTIGRCTAGGDG